MVVRVVMRTGTWRVPRGVRTGIRRVVVRVVVRRTAIGQRPLRLGAAWERAEPAAVLDALPVRPSRSTLLAALAAFGLVRREERAMRLGPFGGLVVLWTPMRAGRWCP